MRDHRWLVVQYRWLFTVSMFWQIGKIYFRRGALGIQYLKQRFEKMGEIVGWKIRRLTKKKMFFHWILILLLNTIIAVVWPVVFNTILIQFVFNLKISQKVHSDDCRLDSGVKWWGHSSSIVTYRRKNSVCLRLNSFINLFLFLKDCELARHLECRKRMMFTEPNFGFNSVFFAKKQGFINTQNVN